MRRGSKLLQILGCLLIFCGLGLLVFSRLHAEKAQTAAAQVLEQIEVILPERTAGAMDTYSTMEMPVLQIGGQDFSAVLDVPAFGRTLPVDHVWGADKVTSFPCRFYGSVYDGSLVIGGADQQGQFDWLDQIQQGSVVTITDMTGAEFSYVVDRVDRSKTAQAEVLISEAADLTLFVRDAYSLEYVIVRCVSGRLAK